LCVFVASYFEQLPPTPQFADLVFADCALSSSFPNEMSEATAPAEIQINVKGSTSLLVYSSPCSSFSKGPSELKLQITISTDKTVLELKQAIADKSDVEADRQRLIYSGTSLCVHL
jgi:hypothetical protein